jgi:hypothetical protein
MELPALKIPTYSFKIKSVDGKELIYDPFRKKYVRLTPEEWVRLNFTIFLVEERSFPAGRIVLEQSLKLNQLSRRCDVLVYSQGMHPQLMVECKAPDVKIDTKVFDQIAVYNLTFRVKYLIVTNGIRNYVCRVNFETRKIEFLDFIPEYADLDQN